MKSLIVSTIGTSLITNPATKEERNLLNQHSNHKEKNCPEEIKLLIEKLFGSISEKLNSSDNSVIRKASAELNGILGFYNEDLSSAENDFHFLISTDTLQGIKSAEVVANFLGVKNIACQPYTVPKLTTLNKEVFSEGIKNLLKWFDETIAGYKNSGYQIIFNLTGGFKSLQGYLNTIAMFYADKIIYIFESESAELIEIPRLPIKIDNSIFENDLSKFLLLADEKLNFNEFPEIHESLIDRIDDYIILSVWGELVWNKVKYQLLKNLVELPNLIYEQSFQKCFDNIIDVREKVTVLETLAKVSNLLRSNNNNVAVLKKDGGLLYEDYKSTKIDNVPVGHFRINQGDRISCQFKNKKLYLRKYGRHDFVNNNP
ncbi:MAG: putative CRISPR-associated protein [Ignavibacteriae bacterium]|nr:putative CRISPR-associated protein [Ignavibacteriota bacterium]NOH00235.1 putative CRISPR-associated protein [Ignavibacteriota bacterium]